jgi:predicted naringenin-chalcone synthase
MPKIIAIGTATPPYRHRQDDIMRFMLDARNLESKTRKLLPILYRRSGIETRYSALPDFSLDRSQSTFFKTDAPIPSLEDRMTLYNEQAINLSTKAINNCLQGTDLQSVTHFITVTCTGLSAPGLDILLMQRLGFPPNIVRTSVNFMGCYAALHALKIADAFCRADASAKVLIVCTELCTIHFQESNDTDAILSSTLFADGSAACLVSSDEEEKGLKIKQFYSKVALSGQNDMAWQLSSNGFLMTLSNHVPKLIKEEIKHLLENSLAQLKLTSSSITNWAVHPGGKNILEAVEQSLDLTPSDLVKSYEILRNYGNMSSATILFVLQSIMQDADKQGNIFAVAFGPGITMESLILEKC